MADIRTVILATNPKEKRKTKDDKKIVTDFAKAVNADGHEVETTMMIKVYCYARSLLIHALQQ